MPGQFEWLMRRSSGYPALGFGYGCRGHPEPSRSSGIGLLDKESERRRQSPASTIDDIPPLFRRIQRSYFARDCPT